VYLYAGRLEEARKLLERSLRACTMMTLTDGPWQRLPFSVIEAHLLLGLAREATDKERTCEAYRFVTDTWRNAKPRSVSVEKARARSKALGCVVPS
jgi:hypothetical protein